MSSLSARSKNITEANVTEPAENDLKSLRAQLAASSSSTDNYSKELGNYLLKGWKMLDETCPVTGAVPLMEVSNRTNLNTISVTASQISTAERVTLSMSSTDVLCVEQRGPQVLCGHWQVRG